MKGSQHDRSGCVQGGAPGPCRTAQAQRPRVALEDVVIGKDVLELLSSAMYVDPMTIYREYVQNAADAIDDARREGILAKEERGTVAIAIDPASRSVRIRDNGSGVAWPEFARKLTALGASGKRGKAARGFRVWGAWQVLAMHRSWSSARAR